MVLEQHFLMMRRGLCKVCWGAARLIILPTLSRSYLSDIDAPN